MTSEPQSPPQLTASEDLVRLFPRLTRFYGIGPAELASIPNNVLNIYLELLPVIEAEEMLNQTIVSDHPHADQKARERVIEMLRDQAGIVEEVETVDPLSDAGRLRAKMFGIGVQSDLVSDDAS